MKMKKIAASTAMAGALVFGALGIGSGVAQADPKVPWPPIPPIPGDVWVPGDPPGHNPFGPPGQVKKDPLSPFYGVPPGHWDDPALYGLPTVWRPDIPDVMDALPVRWNPDWPGWGVWVNPEWFIPVPLPPA